MTDEPKTNSVRPQEDRTLSAAPSSASSKPTSPSSKSTIGDPPRRGYGDKTDDDSKRHDASKAADKNAKVKNPDREGKSDEDAGEGHKGPRVDATTVSSEKRSQDDRSMPLNKQSNKPNELRGPLQQTPKAPQTNVHGVSGGDRSSGKEPEAKPHRI